MHTLNSSPLERLGEVLPIFSLAIGNRATQAKQAITDIGAGKNNTINPDLYKLYNDSYNKALDGVFSDIDPTHPLWEKVQQFKLNTADFAAHKSYQVTKNLNVIASKAKQSPPGTYEKLAKAEIGKYNRYQSAEYNTIISRSRTAKQWDTFQGEKHVYPNLEWMRTSSSTPRELHIGYVGIILPINDPFWQENQPGNLWNCKCDWKTTDADPTPEPDKIVPAQRGLEGNPYETGKLISDDHPYFTNIPNDDIAFVNKEVTKVIRNDAVDYALHNLRDTKVPQIIKVNKKIKPINIGFSRNGIEHFAHDYHPEINYKNLLIKNLDNLVLESEYVASAINTDKKNTMVTNYHYYSVNILGKDWYLNVREQIDGKFILYSITDEIKVKTK